MAITDSETTATPTNGKGIVKLLRKATRGGYKGSKGKVMDNLAQLIGCDGEWDHRIIINKLADMVEEAVQRDEDEMAEHGWVRLPKDGEAPCKQLGEWIENRGLITGPLDHDGELWHNGDMSASPWGEIASIVFDGQCWQVCGHDTSAPWLPADSLSHYHAPTVEDVLREMLDKWGELPSNMTNEAIVAEYAAKLRLAGDAE